MHYNASTVQPLNFDASRVIRTMLIYHTLGMWWTALVIVTVGHYTIASAVSSWYFNAGKYLDQSRNRLAGKYSEKRNCGCCKISCREQIDSPITGACKKGCRYHCGSFALGAALNILVIFVKFAFLWINKLVSMLNGSNGCARKMKSCMFLLMGFFDKFVRIVSRNGYIMMAIRGQNFCTSAGWASWLIFAAQDNPKSLDAGAKDLAKQDKERKKFNAKQTKKLVELRKLKPGATAVYQSISFVSGDIVGPKEVKIMTQQSLDRQIIQEDHKLTSYEGPYKSQSYNAAQYAVLSLITDILLFLGKLVVVVSTGIMAYIWITAAFPVGTLSSSAAPIAVAMLFSYFIVSAFLSVYDMSIDTILLCFFYDKLQNKGGPYAMSPQLKKLVLANLPPGTNKSNMKKGDSFFFSNQVTRQGTISIGAGWDADTLKATNSAQVASSSTRAEGQIVDKPEKVDIDLAMAVFDKEANLLDYIGYMEAVRPNGKPGMVLKKKAGGDLFPDAPLKSLSNINSEACVWSGDDQSGATPTNVAGLNEDITVRLHEMPINVDTLAFVMFSFKGPCINEISDLRLMATECTTSGGGSGRQPEVVAKFNCDFDTESMEGGQQALLCVTLRRNPGPKFPKGDTNWTEGQKTFAREFASEPIKPVLNDDAKTIKKDGYIRAATVKNDGYRAYLAKHIDPKLAELGVSPQAYAQAKALVNSKHEDAYDQILSSEKKNHGRKTRNMLQKIEAFEQVVAADTIFCVLAMASKAKGANLNASQLMVWNRTYSAFNAGPGQKYAHKESKAHGDMMNENEGNEECGWYCVVQP